MTDVVTTGRQLDESGLEQLLAGLTAVRGGDFSIRLRETGDPLKIGRASCRERV